MVAKLSEADPPPLVASVSLTQFVPLYFSTCPLLAEVIITSDRPSHVVTPELEAIVIVSVPASVVMVIFEPAASVKVSVAESAATEVCPATAIVSKLFDEAAAVTVTQVLSPLKYVVASLVPEAPSLSTGTVPVVNCVALSAVRLAPDTAGNVAGKRASGTVPEVNCVALSAVIKLPSPLKLVAVSSPASDIEAELTCMMVPVVPS